MSDAQGKSITGDPPANWGIEAAKQTFMVTMVGAALFVGVVLLFIL